MLVVDARSGALHLTVPTTAPAGPLEHVAGLLVHQACRGRTELARSLLSNNLKALGDHGEDLKYVRAKAGLLGRTTPVPDVVLRALDVVDENPHLSDEGIRQVLHATGLSQGAAGRNLVLGVAGLYRLTQKCSRPELHEVLAETAVLRTIGVTA